MTVPNPYSNRSSFTEDISAWIKSLKNKRVREKEAGAKQKEGETKGKCTVNMTSITVPTCRACIPNCLGTLSSLSSQLVVVFLLSISYSDFKLAGERHGTKVRVALCLVDPA